MDLCSIHASSQKALEWECVRDLYVTIYVTLLTSHNTFVARNVVCIDVSWLYSLHLWVNLLFFIFQVLWFHVVEDWPCIHIHFTCIMHMMVLLVFIYLLTFFEKSHDIVNLVALSKQFFQKVSQLMGRVARLNEAFSVVRRVPIVRPPSLPSSSVTLRPVMSMRWRIWQITWLKVVWNAVIV